MSARTDVLVLGGAGADTFVHVPGTAAPYADYMIDSGIRTRAGQTGDFVALGLSALGLHTHHLDRSAACARLVSYRDRRRPSGPTRCTARSVPGGLRDRGERDAPLLMQRAHQVALGILAEQAAGSPVEPARSQASASPAASRAQPQATVTPAPPCP